MKNHNKINTFDSTVDNDFVCKTFVNDYSDEN